MKKAILILGAALVIAGCKPQGGTSDTYDSSSSKSTPSTPSSPSSTDTNASSSASTNVPTPRSTTP